MGQWRSCATMCTVTNSTIPIIKASGSPTIVWVKWSLVSTVWMGQLIFILRVGYVRHAIFLMIINDFLHILVREQRLAGQFVHQAVPRLLDLVDHQITFGFCILGGILAVIFPHA